MAQDDIPENETESYPCPECKSGKVEKHGLEWTCDTCTFYVEDEED